MGIDVRDPNQTVGTLSGGERQAVAIARAVYFGARVLILDEPTSALGVKQSGIVLKYVVQARSTGLGVIFITHNPHHAYPVGDRFVLLKRGRLLGSYLKSETSLEQLTSMMAGGAELEQLSHELQGLAQDEPGAAEVARELAAELPSERMGQPSAQTQGQASAQPPRRERRRARVRRLGSPGPAASRSGSGSSASAGWAAPTAARCAHPDPVCPAQL